ncbi:MAG: ATP synthase F1 subunit delta [Candidatus Margulisbacteria bacterium]|nr:ATP synthase F1 subunit delta [Candidatus Margulisiibacteriota bacterium]
MEIEIDYKIIYEWAKEDGLHWQLEEELYFLSKLIYSNYELRLFFEDFAVPAKRKIEVLREFFTKDPSPIFVKLTDLLINEGHSDQLSRISERYTRLVSEMEKISFGQIVSAFPLDEKTIARAEATLNRQFNLTFKLKNDVNPLILGGLIIKIIGGTRIDMSLQKTLIELNNSLVSIPV